MPMIKNKQIGDKSRLLVWEIKEDEDYFSSVIPKADYISHPVKQLEYLTGRYLLSQNIDGFVIEDLYIDEYGKPFLINNSIQFSLSHSFPYVAVIISDEPVGIDIQLYEEKIHTIGPRFTSTEETDMTDIQTITAVWCIKEAAYKWYSLGQLEFRTQILVPYIDKKNGWIPVLITSIDGQRHRLHCNYEIHNDYAMAYVWENASASLGNTNYSTSK